jgi:tetratricopeptide (TPR) repeat protein
MERLSGRYAESLTLCDRLREMKGVDADKTADYLEGRVRYEQGQLAEARRLFESALAKAAKNGYGLGPSPYAMRDAWFYLAQLRRKGGDPLGAHEAFKSYLSEMSDPEFQLWYSKKLLPEMGSDQARLYDTIELNWVRERQ